MVLFNTVFSRQHFEIVSYFSQKTGFDISYKLFPLYFLFSGKNKKNITNLSFAESAQRVVKFNPSLAKHDMPCLSKQCRSRSVGF